MNEGRFIVIEGPDGSGKTTLSRALLGAHRRWSSAPAVAVDGTGNAYLAVRVTREPSDGPIGQQIRRILTGGEPYPGPRSFMRLYAADRLHHLAAEVEPLLDGGCDVICDRYVLSSYVYQHGIDGVPLEEVRLANVSAKRPELTLVLRASPAVCFNRMRTRARELEFYEGVVAKQVAMYDQAADLLPGWPVAFIDAARAPDEVLSDALTAIGASSATAATGATGITGATRESRP